VPLLQSVSYHSRSSVSAGTDADASDMRRFNSSTSLAKGETNTGPLTCTHKKKSQGVRTGNPGGHFIKRQSAVWQMLSKVCTHGCRKTGRCAILLEETFTVPLSYEVQGGAPSCWKKLSRFLCHTNYKEVRHLAARNFHGSSVIRSTRRCAILLEETFTVPLSYKVQGGAPSC
jgi:hypothetical protein